jgi:predicted nucleotidyltransferase
MKQAYLSRPFRVFGAEGNSADTSAYATFMRCEKEGNVLAAGYAAIIRFTQSNLAISSIVRRGLNFDSAKVQNHMEIPRLS